MTISARIARFTDEKLTREIAFAEGFAIPGEPAAEWLAALKLEAERRA